MFKEIRVIFKINVGLQLISLLVKSDIKYVIFKMTFHLNQIKTDPFSFM